MSWCCYYSSIIIVSLLFSFVPSLASDCKKVQKLLRVVQETDSVLGQKNSYKITRSSFWSEVLLQHALYNCLSGICSEFFDLSCRSVPEIIIYYLLVCFSQILSCFAFPSFCKPWACFLFAKTFLQSWETVDLQDYPYFQKGKIILLWVLTSLIRLWWVMYEGSFQVCEGRW